MHQKSFMKHTLLVKSNEKKTRNNAMQLECSYVY